MIVNAANEQLLHRAGVAGVLNHASAGHLQKVSNAYMKQCCVSKSVVFTMIGNHVCACKLNMAQHINSSTCN